MFPACRSPSPPTDRRRAVLAAALKPGQRVCLTTHVNPDGDGLGSEAGLVHLLRAAASTRSSPIRRPTPPRFGFLFEDLPGVDRTAEAVKELRRADLIVVLDISDLGRLGMLGETVRDRGVPVACIDHHVSAGVLPPGPRYVDPGAAATGELVFELAVANGWPLTEAAARGALRGDPDRHRRLPLQQHPPAHAARRRRAARDRRRPRGDLPRGLRPRARGPPRLLAEALQTLVVEPEYGLAWVTVPPGAIERLGVSSDDLDGVVEFPRSIEGVRMALLFREMSQGRVKVSLRSVGDVDVAAFAKPFGGGGHTKAAGLSLAGSLAEVQATVLDGRPGVPGARTGVAAMAVDHPSARSYIAE